MPAASDRLLRTSSKRQTVLVVEREADHRTFLTDLFQSEGYVVETTIDGSAILATVAARRPDVVLLDASLPGTNGLEVCRMVRQNVATRLTPIILMIAAGGGAQRIEGLDAGADEVLTKPIDRRELMARARSLVRMKRYTDDLDSASSILTTLATMIEGRDGSSAGHCSRMANYATSLGRALNASEDDTQVLYRGAFLHDVGMLAISDFVLQKPGPLTPEEFEQVKSHTVLGDQLCANLRSLRAIRPVIRWHHERLDGSGYPDALRGDEIPQSAQIVGIVDVFEAVTTARPYQRLRSHDEAFAILRADVERGWRRPDIVEAFVALMQSRA